MTPEEIKHELLFQDKVCTAAPRLIVLEEKNWIPVHNEYHSGETKTEYVCHELSDDDPGFDSREDIKKAALEAGYSEENAESLADHAEAVVLKAVWEPRNWFFTFKGYEEHVKLNSHNYRKEIRPYVVHCFRNPEMQTVWKLIGGDR